MENNVHRFTQHDYLPYSLVKENMDQPHFDLTQYDYEIKNSEWGKLEIYLKKAGKKISSVTLTLENVYFYPYRRLSPIDEEEALFYLDWLLWRQEFLEYAHHSGIRLEVENPEELMEIIQERMGEDLIHVQFERQTGEGIAVDSFMGFLIRARVEKTNQGVMGRFHFTPVDDEADVIEIKVDFDPEGAGIAESIAIKVVGKESELDLARHIEISH